MQALIGTKVILAEPMDECTFLSTVKGQDVTNRETRPGYLVVYPNPGGDYKTWFPKEVIDEAYSPVSIRVGYVEACTFPKWCHVSKPSRWPEDGVRPAEEG